MVAVSSAFVRALVLSQTDCMGCPVAEAVWDAEPVDDEVLDELAVPDAVVLGVDVGVLEMLDDAVSDCVCDAD